MTKRRWNLTKPSTIIKITPGVYVGATSNGRKVYTWAISQESAYLQLTNTMQVGENIKSVFLANDL